MEEALGEILSMNPYPLPPKYQKNRNSGLDLLCHHHKVVKPMSGHCWLEAFTQLQCSRHTLGLSSFLHTDAEDNSVNALQASFKDI